MHLFSNLLTALNWRYAVKTFSPTKLPSSLVETLITATQLSPSAFGLQPYKLIVVDTPSVRNQLVEGSYGQTKVAEASHLFVLAVDNIIGPHTVDKFIRQYCDTHAVSPQTVEKMTHHFKSALQKMNEQEKQHWAHLQAHIALGNLLTSAALLKVDACPMAGFDRQHYDQVLNLNEKGLTASVICAIGIRHPDDAHARQPKVRFGLDEFLVTV